MNVMTRAWEIAKEGQAKFGGFVKEYFAMSLRAAWAELKGMVKMMKVELTSGSRNFKSWVARITGTDAKWGLKREFINSEDYTWELEDGIYQINGAPRDSHQILFENEIVRIENGEIAQYLSKEQAKAIFTK